MIPPDAQQGAGYWYPQADENAPEPAATGVDVLNALRAYRTLESGLRRRLAHQLGVNETDLSAIRVLTMWLWFISVHYITK